MEKCITGKGPNCERDQELDQVLVEHALHDRDHDHPEDSTQGDEEDGQGGGKPDAVVVDHLANLLVLQPHMGRVVGSLCMRVMLVRTVVVALVVVVVVVILVMVVVVVVVVVLCAVIGGVLLAVGEQSHAEEAETLANHQTHLKLNSADILPGSHGCDNPGKLYKQGLRSMTTCQKTSQGHTSASQSHLTSKH